MDRRIVVNDGAVIPADAETLHRRAELFRARQHVRRWVLPVAELVDVEEARCGDMGGQILIATAAAARRHVPGGVNDDEVRLAQMLRQPFGGNERVHASRIGFRGRPC